MAFKSHDVEDIGEGDRFFKDTRCDYDDSSDVSDKDDDYYDE